MAEDSELKRRDFKKTIDFDNQRRKREETQIELRKQRRDEQLAQRRFKTSSGAAADSASITRDPFQDPSLSEKLKMLPELRARIINNDPNVQLEAVQMFRKLLSIERNPPIQEVIDAGVVPIFVRLLQNDDVHASIQFEAAWALTNIASGTSQHTAFVIQCGAVPHLVRLLSSSSEEVREQCIWALGNIAGDSATCRDVVLQADIMTQLIRLCQGSPRISLLRNATWTFSNLCRGKPQPAFNLISHGLPVLASLLYNHDEEVLTDACWALSYLSDDSGPNNERISALLQHNIARRLVDLLAHPSSSVRAPALRSIGNLVTGDDTQTQVIIQAGALPRLLTLLAHPKRNIKKEACWTISNITAGSTEQIEAVRLAGLFPPLIELLTRGEFEVKKEAAWAVANATSGGNDDQIRYLVSQGCLPPLTALFTAGDIRVINVALEAVENILKLGQRDAMKAAASGQPPTNPFTQMFEECGGIDKLENLQRHDNPEIYQKALHLLREFFDVVETDEPGANNPSAPAPSSAPGNAPSSAPAAPSLSFSAPASNSPFHF